MNVEVKKEAGYYSVVVDGQRMVDRESFAVADRVKFYLDHPEQADTSESSEVAHQIREHFDALRCTCRPSGFHGDRHASYCPCSPEPRTVPCKCGKYGFSAGCQIIEPGGMKHGHLECISREDAQERRIGKLTRALHAIADHKHDDPWQAADGMRALARGALLEGP